MNRPDYPNCPMTPGVIRGVKERLRAYDKDPEEYERQERAIKEADKQLDRQLQQERKRQQSS